MAASGASENSCDRYVKRLFDEVLLDVKAAKDGSLQESLEGLYVGAHSRGAAGHENDSITRLAMGLDEMLQEYFSKSHHAISPDDYDRLADAIAKDNKIHKQLQGSDFERWAEMSTLIVALLQVQKAIFCCQQECKAYEKHLIDKGEQKSKKYKALVEVQQALTLTSKDKKNMYDRLTEFKQAFQTRQAIFEEPRGNAFKKMIMKFLESLGLWSVKGKALTTKISESHSMFHPKKPVPDKKKTARKFNP